MTQFDSFRQAIEAGGIEALRAGIIGRDIDFETPFGTKRLLYADYVASGRALRQVEAFVAEHVLPFYSNSHTEASFCGQYTTRLRESARATIARLTGCGPDCRVVFTGSGATAGLNRVVGLLRLAERVRAGARVVVLTGPYEHHSNILPWRETGAEVIELPEAERGGVDPDLLDQTLAGLGPAEMVVGAFSAASNVTGILTDTEAVTRVLKAHGALAVWDYAGGGPYLPMDMGQPAGAEKDAIVFSPHKFLGGPGGSGVLVLRDTIVRRRTPTQAGGGTVAFVSPWDAVYSNDVAVREEAGTPNVIGDIRAALAMLVKDAIGTGWIAARDEALRQRLLNAWAGVPSLRLLGQRPGAAALPIFSFQVLGHDGAPVHHQLFARMLSDHLGIQVRAGCACAGPYAHRLLEIDRAASEQLLDRLRDGHELEKPGWVRLNLSFAHSDEEVRRIIDGVAWLAERAEDAARQYAGDAATARFRALLAEPETEVG